MAERKGEDQHGKMLLGKPASQRGELYCPNKGKKRKEMPMDGGGKRSTQGIMRHQYGRARLGEAPRAVLVLSIPTPREPALERETTADDGNTHLKQATSRRSRSGSKHEGQEGPGAVCVYAPRQVGRAKRYAIFTWYATSATADSRSSDQDGARHGGLSRQQRRQLRGHEPHAASSW
jgi:hypothetical protein